MEKTYRYKATRINKAGNTAEYNVIYRRKVTRENNKITNQELYKLINVIKGDDKRTRIKEFLQSIINEDKLTTQPDITGLLDELHVCETS